MSRCGARTWLCWVLIALCTAPASAQRGPVRSEQETLIELERGWNDEFTATYDDGTRGDKKKELELAASFNQAVESATQDDFVVRVYRDAAVVWFTLNLVGIKQGQRSPLTLRYTDVWVFRDGRWQCVSTQSTRVLQR
jgi:hypothetical protein